MFEPAGKFIFQATQKYKLTGVALGALVCERARNLIKKEYAEHQEFWHPKKFKNGVLHIHATNSSASSVLFLHTHTIIEKLEKKDLPERVLEIRIIRMN